MSYWYKAHQMDGSEQRVHFQHLLHWEFSVQFPLIFSCVQFTVQSRINFMDIEFEDQTS